MGIGAGPRTKLSISRCVEINLQRSYSNESIAIKGAIQLSDLVRHMSTYRTLLLINY